MSIINPHTKIAYRAGASGALLDEYEKALNELIRLAMDGTRHSSCIAASETN